MKAGAVYNNGILAGHIVKKGEKQYTFRYTDEYFQSDELPAISLSFPKHTKEYYSQTLFPFFFGLISEGVNKQTQCRLLKIDENDHFSLLLQTAGSDTIGAITIKPVEI